ncbi:hypothetical protein SEVIR_3G377101v4 [Setaria viridis]
MLYCTLVLFVCCFLICSSTFFKTSSVNLILVPSISSWPHQEYRTRNRICPLDGTTLLAYRNLRVEVHNGHTCVRSGKLGSKLLRRHRQRGTCHSEGIETRRSQARRSRAPCRLSLQPCRRRPRPARWSPAPL